MKQDKRWKKYETLVSEASSNIDLLKDQLESIEYKEHEVDGAFIQNKATLHFRLITELQLTCTLWATGKDGLEIQQRLDSLQTLQKIEFKRKTFELWKHYGFIVGWGLLDDTMFAFSLAMLRSSWHDVVWYAELINKVRVFRAMPECYSPIFLQNFYFELAARVLDPSSRRSSNEVGDLGVMSKLVDSNAITRGNYLKSLEEVSEVHCDLMISKKKTNDFGIFRRPNHGFIPFATIAWVAYQKRVHKFELEEFPPHPMLKAEYFSQPEFVVVNDPMLEQLNKTGTALYGQQWGQETLPDLKDIKLMADLEQD